MHLQAIGHIESPYLTKFGVPRQPGLVSCANSRIVFDSAHAPDIESMEIEPGDSIIVLWMFTHNIKDANAWSKTVRPPLLGGTKRVGVFASRSSFRPNALALSCVHVSTCYDDSLAFWGGDMADGTPVFALYPYLKNKHCVPGASEGWRGEVAWPTMEQIIMPRKFEQIIPASTRAGLYQVLRQDPRPAYTRDADEDRVFWIAYDGFVIWFTVQERCLRVVDVVKASPQDVTYVRETGNVPNDWARA